MLLLLSDGLSSDKEIARPLRSDEIVPIALLLVLLISMALTALYGPAMRVVSHDH